MKSNIRFLVVLVFLTAFNLLAQTNSVPTLPGASSTPPDASLAKLLLAVIVPLVVAGIKKITPSIPSVSLPVIAIVLGAGADYVGSLVGVWEGSFVVGAVLGAAGVGLREAGDQVKQSVLGPTPEPPK